MEKINKIIVIVVWIAAIYLMVAKGFFYIAAGILALHIAEVFIKGIPVGKQAGKSLVNSIIMTLIYGFAWWLPLEKQMKEQ